MSNELMIPEELKNQALAQYGDDDFNTVAKTGNYLRRLQLFTGRSKAVAAKVVPVNHWGSVGAKDDVTDLGEAVDFYVLAWRPAARKFPEKGPPISVYDTKDPRFAEIQSQAGVEDSGCSAGPEFLVYVPAVKQFLTYHATGNNAREDAKKLRPLIPPAGDGKANISGRVREQGKYVNYVPVTRPANGPIGDPPSQEAITEQMTNFLNPKEWEEAKPEEPAAEGGRVR